MRISGKSSGVGSSTGVSASKAPASSPAPAPVAGTTPGDALQVSGGARLMAVAQAALAAVPDVRTEKVEALRARLDSEAYSPDGEAVAHGLIQEHSPLEQA